VVCGTEETLVAKIGFNQMRYKDCIQTWATTYLFSDAAPLYKWLYGTTTLLNICACISYTYRRHRTPMAIHHQSHTDSEQQRGEKI